MTYSCIEACPTLRQYAIAFIGLMVLGGAPLLIPAHAHAASLDIWWPVSGAHVTGLQPFKGMVPAMDVGSYDLYWRVDGGNWVPLWTSYEGYPHKEASVDVSGWTWHGSGPYVVDFSAEQNGVAFASYTSIIYVDNGLPGWTPSAPSAQPAASTPNAVSSFYVNPNVRAEAASAPQIASTPTATWIGDWTADVAGAVSAITTDAAREGATPVLVAYDLPERDCAGYSGGGASSPGAYRSWIRSFAEGLGGRSALVILEPDALAQIDCLSSADQTTRYALLSYAVRTLSAAGASVYLDAGHSGWIDAGAMANRLASSGVAAARGFSLNVSNFMPTAAEERYGTDIANRLGGAHFVIDTSRNGAGSDGTWCNPPGAALGIAPTTATGNPLVDAFLWVKVPGESDGTCNGGPAAGVWWPQGAAALIRNALL